MKYRTKGNGDSNEQRGASKYEIFPHLGKKTGELLPGDLHEDDSILIPNDKKKHGYEESPHSRDGK